MLFRLAENELIEAMAKRARRDMEQQEDQRMCDEIGMGVELGTHKVFDEKNYRRALLQLTKKQLIDALVREAELRYSGDCNISDYRRASDSQQGKIRNLTADLTKWKNAARRMAEALNSLVNI